MKIEEIVKYMENLFKKSRYIEYDEKEKCITICDFSIFKSTLMNIHKGELINKIEAINIYNPCNELQKIDTKQINIMNDYKIWIGILYIINLGMFKTEINQIKLINPDFQIQFKK